MTLNAYQEEKIIEALLNFYRNQWDGTDAHFATIFGLNSSVFARLKKGERERLIRSDKLITIGRLLDVHWKDAAPWKIVNTKVYDYIQEQLAYCKENSISRIYCDRADIGKSTAAKAYKLREKNVYYIDCSKVKTKTHFVKAFAKTIGVNANGALATIIADTVYLLQSSDRPLVILDEAGDLGYDAWLELKAYWNALEGYCGWYMLGADGLRRKVNNNLRNERVGYAEIFRRYGSEFMNILYKSNPVEQAQIYRAMMEQVAHANLPPGVDVREFMKQQKVMSLTRLKENIQKLKQPNQLPLKTADA